MSRIDYGSGQGLWMDMICPRSKSVLDCQAIEILDAQLKGSAQLPIKKDGKG